MCWSIIKGRGISTDVHFSCFGSQTENKGKMNDNNSSENCRNVINSPPMKEPHSSLLFNTVFIEVIIPAKEIKVIVLIKPLKRSLYDKYTHLSAIYLSNSLR